MDITKDSHKLAAMVYQLTSSPVLQAKEGMAMNVLKSMLLLMMAVSSMQANDTIDELVKKYGNKNQR